MENTNIAVIELPQELVTLQSTFKTQIDSSDILQKFAPFFYELAEIKKAYSEIKSFDNPDKEDSLKANEIRKRIVKVRTTSERLKDETGKDYHIIHKMITSANTLINTACKMDESTLEKVTKFAEIQEQKRLDALREERASFLVPYGFNVDDAVGMEKMTDEVWSAFLSGAKKQHDDRVEAAAKIEAERIEKENEQRLENERLKKEAAEKEIIRNKRNGELRPYIIFIRDYNKMLDMQEDEYQKEFEGIKIAAQQQWDYDRQEELKKAEFQKIQFEKDEAEKKKQAEEKTKIEAELKAANEAKAKVEAELKAKADAERKAAEDKAAEEKKRIEDEIKAAKAPKKQKLSVWVDGFVMGAPIGMSEDETVIEILKKFEAFKKWALTQIETL